MSELIICRGPDVGNLPDWAIKTTANWCQGCPGNKPHYEGDLPMHISDGCQYCNTQPIDQVVVDEIYLDIQIKAIEESLSLMTSLGGYRSETEEGPEEEEARVRWLEDTHKQRDDLAQGQIKI